MQRLEILRLLTIAEAPQLSKTKTSKASDKLIDQFQNRLAAFVWLSQQRRITEDDKKRLFVIFYKYTEAQYFLGQEYADKASGETKPVSKGDLQKIDNLARQSLKDFWKSLQKQGITHDFDHSINWHDIDKLLATHNDFDEVIQQAWKGKEAIPNFLDAIGNIMRNLMGLIASDSGIRALNQGTISSAQTVVFTTRVDSRVCPICIPLHGKIYKSGDPNMIQIPTDTHPNCRCRYLVAGDIAG